MWDRRRLADVQRVGLASLEDRHSEKKANPAAIHKMMAKK
jgi:hypothetical protein